MFLENYPKIRGEVEVAAQEGDDIYLRSIFDELSESTQKEILQELKKHLPNPEHVAEREFNTFVHDTYTQERIERERQEGIALHAPGEMYLHQSTGHDQVYEPLSLDERRGGDRYDAKVTTYWLVVGAQEIERPNRGFGKYTGGTAFRIASGEHIRRPEESLEVLRTALVKENKKNIEEIFSAYGRWHGERKPDRRICDDPEAWEAAYQRRGMELERELREKWKKEDDQVIEEQRKTWEIYQEAAQELRAAREQVRNVQESARKQRIHLNDDWDCDLGNIGKDSVEEMRSRAEELRAYVPRLEAHLTEVARTRAEEGQVREEAERARQERKARGSVQATKHLGDVGGESDQEEGPKIPEWISTLATALAREAQEVLGTDNALTILRNVFEAPYGILGRKRDVGEALGDDTETLQTLLGLQRRGDFDGVLAAALQILEHGREGRSPQIQASESEVSSSKDPVQVVEQEKTELPRLFLKDNKDWWSHEAKSGLHTGKFTKDQKKKYQAGERVEVQCSACEGKTVGYLHNETT